MRLLSRTLVVILMLSTIGCDYISCTSINRSRTEHVRKLSDYILKRTVRIFYKGASPAWGSGAILYSCKEYSLILTAGHVVIGEKRKAYVQVIDRTGTIRKDVVASVVSSDKGSDLALLRVDVDLGVSSSVYEKNNYAGQWVAGAGFPYMPGGKVNWKSITFAQGLVENVGLRFGKSKTFIRFSIPVYGGFSGGGIWNSKGQVVGIVSQMWGTRTLGNSFVPFPGYSFGPGVLDIRKFLSTTKYSHLFI